MILSVLNYYNIKLIPFWIFFVVILINGCRSTESMQSYKTIDQSHPRVRLIVGGSNLQNQIKLIKQQVAPFGKMMRGRASIQNLTDKRLVLEYKIDWFDDEGFIIGDGGIWERFSLGPRAIRSFKSLGKSKFASTMQFMVRFPDDTFMDVRN